MSKPSRKRRNPRRQSMGSPETASPHHLPHTPSWFAALARVNPYQALHTRAIVLRAGQRDVCTICGDTPAPIYDLLERPFLPLRLCAECREIQQGLGTQIRLRAASREVET